jgi:hypothetical protein
VHFHWAWLSSYSLGRVSQLHFVLGSDGALFVDKNEPTAKLEALWHRKVRAMLLLSILLW